jgi:hypothetical protein
LDKFKILKTIFSRTLYLRCASIYFAGPSGHAALGYGYIEARTDTTQQSGQTPDKEVEIKNFTDYVSGCTETDTTGMLSLPTVWPYSVAVDIDSNVDMYMS